MLWFKSKNKDKTIEVTCPPSDVCKVVDCRLNDLRNNQATQKKIKERIKDLKNQYFPMVYWWVCICQKVGRCNIISSNNICRWEIEATVQRTIFELLNDPYHVMNKHKFDVDQFCKEMKDIFTTDQQLIELNQQLNELIESEKNLKKALGIS